jgi:hypothetical protein
MTTFAWRPLAHTLKKKNAEFLTFHGVIWLFYGGVQGEQRGNFGHLLSSHSQAVSRTDTRVGPIRAAIVFEVVIGWTLLRRGPIT